MQKRTIIRAVGSMPEPILAGPLARDVVHKLLGLDIPAHLATVGRAGFPRITPIWFLWTDGAFYMTSVVGRQHLQDLSRNRRAFLCIDTEQRQSVQGFRHHRQVRARGLVELAPEVGGEWTRRITLKYIQGPHALAADDRRAAMERVVIKLQPLWMKGTGT